MNSRVILEFIGVVLFLAACAPPNVRSADQSRDGIVSQQMHNNENKSRSSLELHDELYDKELSRVLHRDLSIGCAEECSHKLLEEIEKNETDCQKKRDQQADILEKLLLESTISEAASITPEPQ